jgi:sulfur transfer complex TusBCD TusB component (DsrH family)
MNNNFKYNKTTGKFDAPKSVTEGKNDFMARGMNTNIHVKNQPNADISEKIYTELITFMKKHKVSPKEITFKF